MQKQKKMIFFIILLIFLLSTSLLAKTFTFEETDLVNLEVKTIDPDNDKVTITYSPPLNNEGKWQTNYDDAGVYSIKVTASDGKKSSIETVTLIIKDKNRAPSSTHTSLTVKEGEVVSFDLPKEDIDGDTLSYIFKEPFNSEGVWQTTFEDSGDYNLEIEVSDGDLVNTTIIDVKILNVDLPPVLELPESLEVYENQTLEWSLPAHDPDGDKLEITINQLPEGAILNQDDATLTWTPNFDFIKRKENFFNNVLNALHLEHYFLKEKRFPLNVQVCAHEYCVSDNLEVIVYNTNRKPNIDFSKNLTVKETEKFSLDFKAIDPDGDLVQYEFSSPLSMKGKWKTRSGDQGEHIFYVKATDGFSTNEIPISVKVLPNNKKPEINIKKDQIIINEGEPFEFLVTASDPDNDSLSLIVDNLPEGTSFNNGVFSGIMSYDTINNRSGQWEDNLISNMAFLNRHLSSESNTIWLEFTASDKEYNVVHPVKLTVKNINRQPEIVSFSPEEEITVKVNQPLVFQVEVQDKDNDKLSYTWSFSFHEPKIKDTNIIERTFVAPGKKKVKVLINDGRLEVKKEWVVNVLEQEYNKINDLRPEDFMVYVIKV